MPGWVFITIAAAAPAFWALLALSRNVHPPLLRYWQADTDAGFLLAVHGQQLSGPGDIFPAAYHIGFIPLGKLSLDVDLLFTFEFSLQLFPLLLPLKRHFMILALF